MSFWPHIIKCRTNIYYQEPPASIIGTVMAGRGGQSFSLDFPMGLADRWHATQTLGHPRTTESAPFPVGTWLRSSWVLNKAQGSSFRRDGGESQFSLSSTVPTVPCEVWGRLLGIKNTNPGSQLSAWAESPHLSVWSSRASSQVPKHRTLELSHHTGLIVNFQVLAAPVIPDLWDLPVTYSSEITLSVTNHSHLYPRMPYRNPT